MKYTRIPVNCHSNNRLNERPESFTYQGRHFEVKQVLDRWYEGGIKPGRPEIVYFKVLTRGDQEFILRYNTLFDAWALLVHPDT